MKRNLVLMALVPVLLSAVWAGNRARTQVAVTKVVDRIDEMLGHLDVRRQEIDQAVVSLKGSLTDIRKARIRSQIKQEQLQEQTQPLSQRKAQIDEALTTLKTPLAEGTSAQLAGRTYSPSQVRQMVERLLQARRLCQQQLDGFQEVGQRLADVVTSLEGQEADCELRLAGIEQRLALCDVDRTAIQAMQGASQFLEDSAGGLPDRFRSAEAKVKELYAEVQAELGIRGARWNPRSSEREIGAVDDILAKTKSNSTLLAEVEAALQQPQVAAAP